MSETKSPYENTIMVSNVKQITGEFMEKVETCLMAMGETAVGYAMENCPVKTSRLKNSITYATPTKNNYNFAYKDDNGKVYVQHVGDVTEKNTVYIGTNVRYAKRQEFGDYKHPRSGRKHFLRDAVSRHNGEYKAIAKAILEK